MQLLIFFGFTYKTVPTSKKMELPSGDTGFSFYYLKLGLYFMLLGAIEYCESIKINTFKLKIPCHQTVLLQTSPFVFSCVHIVCSSKNMPRIGIKYQYPQINIQNSYSNLYFSYTISKFLFPLSFSFSPFWHSKMSKGALMCIFLITSKIKHFLIFTNQVCSLF